MIMSKELEALKRLEANVSDETDYFFNDECIKDYLIIEKSLKDFEWLKSVISIDMFEQLPTPEDKVRFLEIMGVKCKYE